LVTYVIGALVSRDQLWIATTIAVLSMLLLELKEFLENLTVKIPAIEILTFTKFLLLTFVILPVVPDSHGCIRMPEKMAKLYWDNAPLGTPVTIEQ